MQEDSAIQAAEETKEAENPPQCAEPKEGEARMPVPVPVFAASAKGPLARPESRRDQINGALRRLAAGKL